jgi:DNA-binding PucR family transcriptional regulator
MRKVTELTDVDLGEPDVRLALLAQLVTVHWG